MRRRQFVDFCYAKYGPLSKSVASFGNNNSLHVPGTGFMWSSADENNLKTSIMGQVADYDGSGFVRDLDPSSRDQYIEAVDELRHNLWVDEQTRAIIISMNLYVHLPRSHRISPRLVISHHTSPLPRPSPTAHISLGRSYNGNYNYYCVSQFLIEFTPGGSLVPTATNKIVSLDLYESSDLVRVENILVKVVPDFLTLFGFIAYVFAFLYRTYRIRKVTKSFRPLLRDSWNVVDLLLLCTLGTCHRSPNSHLHTSHLHTRLPRSNLATFLHVRPRSAANHPNAFAPPREQASLTTSASPSSSPRSAPASTPSSTHDTRRCRTSPASTTTSSSSTRALCLCSSSRRSSILPSRRT